MWGRRKPVSSEEYGGKSVILWVDLGLAWPEVIIPNIRSVVDTVTCIVADGVNLNRAGV